jgi:hypothetical protein
MRPSPRAGDVVTAVVLVVIGALVGGFAGGAAAFAGLAIARWRGYRSVAGVALAVLILTAALTVLEAPATGDAADYLFDFALDRPLAAEAGRVAGVLTIVAIALAARRERAPTSVVGSTADEEHTDG